MAALLAELGYPAPADAVAARLARFTAQPGTLVLLACSRGGDVVGLAALHVAWILQHDPPTGYLVALVVRPDARRRGVATALVDALENEARARGCGRMSLTTREHRADAHAFYERRGYHTRSRRYVKSLGTDS